MFDVVALGELLIDFTPHGISEQQNGMFEANPGGAPCNVLSMLSKCQRKTAFIGKVGQDMFGHLLKKRIEEASISSQGLVMSEEVKTTLAFVQIDDKGDRDFAFYRNPGADMMLTEEEVDLSLLNQTQIFHFGTLSMTHEAVRAATLKALNYAKDHQVLISFDPNLRPPLWSDMEEARQQMLYGCSKCDILKIEDEELKFMTGYETIEDGVSYLKKNFTITLILVTSGAKGSRAYYQNICVIQNAYLSDHTIDTTGAGDSFYGCCLHAILETGLSNFTEHSLKQMLSFASAAASIVTTRKGAIRSMPTQEEIKTLMYAVEN